MHMQEIVQARLVGLYWLSQKLKNSTIIKKVENWKLVDKILIIEYNENPICFFKSKYQARICTVASCPEREIF